MRSYSPCINTMIASILILVLYFLPQVKSAAISICYLIDETQDKRTSQYNFEEKIQVARNISRCLRSKDANIATVIYDNNSAKLGFNFKSIDDILNDGFQQMIVNQRQRRNTQDAHRNQKKLLKRTTIRLFSGTKAKKFSDTDSPQTMAFLTAAEAVVAAESQSTGRVSNFKLLVISDSDVFPVMDDVKNYFLNASVEINAVDLSKDGSSELERIVTAPSAEHYFHSPVIIQQSVVNDVCKTLLKAPLQNNVKPFFKVSKLLTRPLKEMTSSYAKESPQYHYQADAIEGNEVTDLNTNLDGEIEGDSAEYKWSPHPELGPAESVEVGQDTPEELYGAEDKRDICKYLHDECNNHMQAGLCTDDDPQAQSMKKFCKTTCGFCV